MLKVYVIIEGKPNQLFTQRMRSFEQYDEICKYFAERKQRDANEVQKQLKLHDLSIREYLDNKYALWLDFKTIDENINETQELSKNTIFIYFGLVFQRLWQYKCNLTTFWHGPYQMWPYHVI